jgi:Fur family transcriptional regulator, ferric uptake regulator
MRTIRKRVGSGQGPTGRPRTAAATQPRESLLELMRSRGLRVTGQRKVLAELLDRASEHLDVETVLLMARRKDPSIHRATVYRTLETLKKLGLVDELDLMHVSGERHFYEVRPSSLHIHLVCIRCKTVDEPSGAFWDDLKHRVQQERGFVPEVVRIEMAGLCRRCDPRTMERDRAEARGRTKPVRAAS